MVVKLTGKFAYNIRWFPYVIFDAKSFGNLLGIANYSVSVVLLVASCILLFFLYFTLYTLLIKGKSKNITLVVDGETDKNF